MENVKKFVTNFKIIFKPNSIIEFYKKKLFYLG